MAIRKNNPQSEFWKAAEAASRRVEKFPPWKLGVIEPRASQAKAGVTQQVVSATSMAAENSAVSQVPVSSSKK